MQTSKHHFLFLLLLTFIVRSQVLNPISNCLGNCLNCASNDLSACKGAHPCEWGYYINASNGICTLSPSKEVIWTQLGQRTTKNPPPMSESWGSSTKQITCEYTSTSGKKYIDALGMFGGVTMLQKTFPVNSGSRFFELSFNLLRDEWMPFNDFLIIHISSKDDTIQSIEISYEKRIKVESQPTAILCGNKRVISEKYNVKIPNSNNIGNTLTVSFTSFLSTSLWGLSNIKLLSGCTHFSLYDQNTEQCSTCDTGFYLVTLQDDEKMCDRCSLLCRVCSTRTNCTTCHDGAILNKNRTCSFGAIFKSQQVASNNPQTTCSNFSFYMASSKKITLSEIKNQHSQLYDQIQIYFKLYYNPSDWTSSSNTDRLSIKINQVEVFVLTFKNLTNKGTILCKSFQSNYTTVQQILTPKRIQNDNSITLEIQYSGKSKDLQFGVSDVYLKSIKKEVASAQNLQQQISNTSIESKIGSNIQSIVSNDNILNNSDPKTLKTDIDQLNPQSSHQNISINDINSVEAKKDTKSTFINFPSSVWPQSNNDSTSQAINQQNSLKETIYIPQTNPNTDETSVQQNDTPIEHSNNNSITILPKQTTVDQDTIKLITNPLINSQIIQNATNIASSQINQTNTLHIKEGPITTSMDIKANVTVGLLEEPILESIDNYDIEQNTKREQNSSQIPKVISQIGDNSSSTIQHKTDDKITESRLIREQNSQKLEQIVKKIYPQNPTNTQKANQSITDIIRPSQKSVLNTSITANMSQNSQALVPTSEHPQGDLQGSLQVPLASSVAYVPTSSNQQSGLHVVVNDIPSVENCSLQVNIDKLEKGSYSISDTYIQDDDLHLFVAISQSFIKGKMTIYKVSSVRLLQATSKSSVLAEVHIDRFDSLSSGQLSSIHIFSVIFQIFAWIGVVAVIVAILLGYGIIMEQYIMSLQLLFLHAYIAADYLPLTFRDVIGGLNIIQNLNFFVPTHGESIEKSWLGNVIQNGPIRFFLFNTDINFTRQFYPIIIINLFYALWFLGLFLSKRYLLRRDLIDEEKPVLYRVIDNIICRPINYIDQIWRYQFLATVWCCFIQFYNLKYPEGSDRSQVINAMLCVLAFICSLAWPIFLGFYCRKFYYENQYSEYLYRFEDVYFRRIPEYYLPSNHHRIGFPIIRSAKLFLAAIIIAYFGSIASLALILLVCLQLFESGYAKYHQIFSDHTYFAHRLIQNVLFALVELILFFLCNFSSLALTQSYVYIGFVLSGMGLLIILNSFARSAHLTSTKYKQMFEEMDWQGAFNLKPKTERIV